MAREDSPYTDYIHRLPCHICQAQPVEAHHRTGAGLALRAHDREQIPLCYRHHREFHDAAGYFRGWLKEQRDQWQNAAIAKLQKDYDECF
jgi:hypothetical protein